MLLNRPDLDPKPKLFAKHRGGVKGCDGDGFFYALRLDDEDAAKLFFGLDERAIGDGWLSASWSDGFGEAGVLKPLFNHDLSGCSEGNALGKAGFHGLALHLLWGTVEGLHVEVSKAKVFHFCFPSLAQLWLGMDWSNGRKTQSTI